MGQPVCLSHPPLPQTNGVPTAQFTAKDRLGTTILQITHAFSMEWSARPLRS